MDLVNKNSSFADFVSFLPNTYAHTQQFLPPLWAAIKTFSKFFVGQSGKNFQDLFQMQQEFQKLHSSAIALRCFQKTTQPKISKNSENKVMAMGELILQIACLFIYLLPSEFSKYLLNIIKWRRLMLLFSDSSVI